MDETEAGEEEFVEEKAKKALGERVAKIVDRLGGKRESARQMGISETYLYRIISGRSSPTVFPLVAIAKSAHVSLDWLLTGEGNMDGAGNQVPTIDRELLALVIESTSSGLSEVGQKVGPKTLARFVSAYYLNIVKGYADPTAQKLQAKKIKEWVAINNDLMDTSEFHL